MKSCKRVYNGWCRKRVFTFTKRYIMDYEMDLIKSIKGVSITYRKLGRKTKKWDGFGYEVKFTTYSGLSMFITNISFKINGDS